MSHGVVPGGIVAFAGMVPRNAKSVMGVGGSTPALLENDLSTLEPLDSSQRAVE